MRISFGTFAALLITGSMFLQPSHAQSVPQGSYRTTCTNIRVEDRSLPAVCRIADGREQRTSLTDVDRCVGDVGDDDGALTCVTGSRWRRTVRIAGKNILGFGKMGRGAVGVRTTRLCGRAPRSAPDFSATALAR
jgi:hypothetical protein